MVGILDKLAPQEEVAKFESGADSELTEVQSFIFEMNKEGELPFEHLPELIEEPVQVEQSPVLIVRKSLQ